MEKQLNARKEWVDMAKGIGIIMIMMGHCYLDQSIVFWFVSFHMSVFFFCAGVTYHKKDSYICFFTKKVKTLLVPYCFFAMVRISLSWFMSIKNNYEYNLANEVLLYLVQKRYTVLWFLPCLFVAMQLIYFTSIIVKDKWLLASIIWFLVFVLYRYIIDQDLMWNSDLAFLATSVLCIGKKYEYCEDKVKLDGKKIWLLGSTCFTLSYVNYKYFGDFDWYSNRFANPILSIIAIITGVSVIIGVTHKYKNKWLIILGKNTIVFYGLHRTIIDIILVIYGKMGIEYSKDNILQIPLAVASVAITILVLIPNNWMINKYIPWIVGKRIYE